ncbi:MAG: hypothetical protein J0H63_07150 [Rhizobiales bacterium]|nr:hypothetical protein [Hyphomicrobiales bacterium]MBN9009910.1 hypothetical protein [Hyphomicrobiales bacterium]
MKTRRYRRITEEHLRRPARAGDLDVIRASMRDRQALVAIAFNDPEVIGWQVRLLRRHLPGVLYLVADNSTHDVAAGEIRSVCERHGAGWLRLPRVAWERGVTSRSHGLALNWVWRNLIRPAGPASFGFIDHDLFPIAPDDPFRWLDRQDFYGHVRSAGTRWFLWAGFCFFRFDHVRGLPLDFGQDWFNGLDTGGANWNVLYSAARRAGLCEEPLRELALDVAGKTEHIQQFGQWLHLGDMSGGDRPGAAGIRARKRAAVARLIAPCLAGAEEDSGSPQ